MVVIPVQRPGLNLPLGALSSVKEFVERVQAMIARRADLAQPGFELIRGQKLSNDDLHSIVGDSNPAASTSRRSGEPLIRIGLVLLMCVNIRRAVKPPSRRSVPSGPLSGMYPCAVRFWFRCRPDHLVVEQGPSNSTTSARSSRPIGLCSNPPHLGHK